MKSKPSPAFVGALSLNSPAQPASGLLVTPAELQETILKVTDTKKMRTCSHLLPDPGGEVVRECLDEIERLHQKLFTLGAMHDSPCFACGYDGPGYYQPETHPCATLHHKLAQSWR